VASGARREIKQARADGVVQQIFRHSHLDLEDRGDIAFCPGRVVPDVDVMTGSTVQVSQHKDDQVTATIQNVRAKPALPSSKSKPRLQVRTISETDPEKSPLVSFREIFWISAIKSGTLSPRLFSALKQ
jgi:hypothetical protein